HPEDRTVRRRIYLLCSCWHGSPRRASRYHGQEKRPRCPLRRETQRGTEITSSLIARVLCGGFFDFRHDATEVVRLGRLERRELLECLQVVEPQLLANRQHIPIVLEGGDRTAQRTAESHGRLLVDTNRLLEWVALDVLHQREVERNERHDPAGWPGL